MKMIVEIILANRQCVNDEAKLTAALNPLI